MFWFRPWHRRRWHRRWHRPYGYRPFGCGPLGCLWVLVVPLFVGLAWMFSAFFMRLLWW